MVDRVKLILDEIKNGSRKDVKGIIFSVEELLSKDSDGVTFLENLFKNWINLDNINNDVIKNNIEIAYLYCKYDKYLDFFELSGDDLFSIVNDGVMYVEYFMARGKFTQNMQMEMRKMAIKKMSSKESDLIQLDLEEVNRLGIKDSDGVYGIEQAQYASNKEKYIPLINDPNVLLELALKYNDNSWVIEASEQTLMSNMDNGKSFLLYLLTELKIEPKLLFGVFSDEFAVFLYNNGLYDYLLYESFYLLEICPGKILLEGLIEKGYKPKSIYVDNEQIFKVLCEKNCLGAIEEITIGILKKSINEVLRKKTVDDDKTVLEYLLDKGYNPLKKDYVIRDVELVRTLCKKRRIDLLEKIPFDVFLSMEDGYVYFNYMLESFKDKVLLSNSMVTSEILDRLFKYSIIPDKYSIRDYILKLDKEILLTRNGNKTILDILIEIDRDYVVNLISSSALLFDKQIISILNSRGIDINKNDSNVLSCDMGLNFELDLANRYGIGPLSEEGEVLLNELEELFLTDGKSDKDLISILISGYRHALLLNYSFYIKEIKNLILIKRKNYDKFYYFKTNDGSCFDYNSIYCNNLSFDTLMHETGHAIHYYLSSFLIPEDYSKVANGVVQNEDLLIAVEKFSKSYKEIKTLIELLLKQRYLELFGLYYNDSKKREIIEYLKKEEDLRRKKFSELLILNVSLNNKLVNDFAYDKFMNYQMDLFIEDKIFRIMQNEFEYLLMICDILDALYGGELFSGRLNNKQGRKIEKIPGHGRFYYSSEKNQFSEIIANFLCLLKSKDSLFGLSLLKSLIGDDMYSFLYDFYTKYLIDGKNTSVDINGKVR